MKKIVIIPLVFLIPLMIGSAAFPSSVTSESPLGTAGAGKAEVSLGDLVADSIRASLGADAALVSASELVEKDAQIPRGSVSSEEVAKYVAYTDDPIVRMRLSGKQIADALERSVLIYPQKNLGFLQVSGITFSFSSSKPAENRVTSIKVGGRSISQSGTYTVAMTSSMANGALGYWKVWKKDDIEKVTSTTIPNAVDQYFSGRSNINYSNLNRISAD